jgi:2-polyprenyl-3-methyl-5-hydroxy-6-metoxy-1,4-benzoquinol methylase
MGINVKNIGSRIASFCARVLRLVASKDESIQVAPTLEQLGIAHINETGRVGLRDDVEAGFYQNATGEVYRGVSISKDDIVVDVGCGSGGPLQFLSTRGAKVIAVDVSAEVIEIARSAVESQGGVVEFRVAHTQALPVPDDFATRVVCMEVLEHVDDPSFSLSEMFRVGKSGALYLLTVPDSNAERIIGAVGGSDYFEKPLHIRVIERIEFEDLVRNAGLEILSHDYSGFVSTIRLALGIMRGTLDLNGRSTLDEEDAILLKWSRMWNELLDSPEGPEMKKALDFLVPRSQIIVARKP